MAKAQDEKTIYHQICFVSNMLHFIYKELIEMSEEVEYKNGEGNAEDELKALAGCLMDEIQKLYPIDY